MNDLIQSSGMSREELIAATLDQLNSDLAATGFDQLVLDTEILTAASIGAELERSLAKGENNPERLLQLLYRFSVPEEKGIRALKEGRKALSNLLLRRAMEKVVWRWLSARGGIP